MDLSGQCADEPRRISDETVTPIHPKYPMNLQIEALQSLTRRHFLSRTANGLGAIALGSLLKGSLPAAAATPATSMLAAHSPKFPGKAKRVIYLHLTGSPPHLDLFDYKPELVKRTGQDCPDAFLKGKRFAFTSGTPKLLGTPELLPVTDKAASGSRTPCPTCKPWPTNCASSAR